MQACIKRNMSRNTLNKMHQCRFNKRHTVLTRGTGYDLEVSCEHHLQVENFSYNCLRVKMTKEEFSEQ